MIKRPWIVEKPKDVRQSLDPFYATKEWDRMVRDFFGSKWNNRAKKYIRTKNLFCEMCKPNIREATVCDHIIPRRLGGKDHELNFQGLCYKCHQKKTILDRTKYAKRANIN